MSMQEMFQFYQQVGLGQAEAEIERKKQAQGIRESIRLEQQDSLFVTDNGLEEYVTKARGLRHFLDFVLGVDGSHGVLDIGGGKLQGPMELAKTIYGQMLEFSATSLSHPSRLPEFLGKFYRTSGAYLRGVKKESLAGVIALQSIGFSKSLTLDAASMERVVVKGGIFKGTFQKHTPYGEPWETKYREWGYQTHDEFTNTLKKLGWDVAISEGTPGDDSEDDVVVAIKPGGVHTLSAQEVLDADLEEYRKHKNTIVLSD